ncbi:MAG TPA: BadF/BadG/BcrA/BcrD ATPase family protein [Hyphomonadaceae bacterium]|jgi:glucosamine kinase|nr:BadF/BadG/BcrA/BcrD ATPase family protein [Hyphomonadaceae bacterium]HPN04667.1 BadF/BadG/BcrA/BcrD ATPase family protein [Hyphomonadaceae bacterium]
MTATYYLGVDGGGTRCRARLETADGKVLGRGLSGPASMRFGFETARESIMAATRQALTEAGLDEDAMAQTYAGIGLAGTGQLGARAALEAWKHPFAAAWFEGDGYLAYLGAFSGGDGGIVVCGTGSIGITYDKTTIRVGGYGFPVSDEGSGAHIGLNAIRYALRTLDGRTSATAFANEILERFQSDPAVVIRWSETASATDYAAFAAIVIKHATSGEPAAINLLRDAAVHIAGLVEAVLARGARRVALVGGLVEFLKPHIPPATAERLTEPVSDAMAGGILLAKTRQAGA